MSPQVRYSHTVFIPAKPNFSITPSVFSVQFQVSIFRFHQINSSVPVYMCLFCVLLFKMLQLMLFLVVGKVLYIDRLRAEFSRIRDTEFIQKQAILRGLRAQPTTVVGRVM